MAEVEGAEPVEPDITAGEYALGVLEGEELATAQRLYLADRTFADKVIWWRYRLTCMAEAAGEFEPSPDVWPAIERRLSEQRESDGFGTLPLQRPAATRLPAFRLGVGMAGAAAAAALLTFLLLQPAGGPPENPVETSAPLAGERLIAQLQSEDGMLTLAGFVDQQEGQLAVNLAGFDPGEGQATELWVVPEGGAPQSLGLIPSSGNFTRDLTASERASLIEGASLAVTYEDASNAPHEAPTTDILVIGGLTSI